MGQELSLIPLSDRGNFIFDHPLKEKIQVVKVEPTSESRVDVSDNPVFFFTQRELW